MNISSNFTLYEAGRSSTADRLGIDNTPPADLMPRLQFVAETILEPVRAEFGSFRPNSWYRGEALERALCWGGDNEKSSFARWCGRRGLVVGDDAWSTYFPRKQHPKGDAVDFEIVGVSNDDLAQWVADNLVFDQLIREFPRPGDPASGWVHVSAIDGDNRGEIMTIGSGGTRFGLG